MATEKGPDHLAGDVHHLGVDQDQLPALATEMGQARCGPHQTTHQETPMV